MHAFKFNADNNLFLEISVCVCIYSIKYTNLYFTKAHFAQ